MKKTIWTVVALALLLSSCGGVKESPSQQSEGSQESYTVEQDNGAGENIGTANAKVIDNRNKSSKKGVAVNDSDFDITEYIYETSIGSSECFLVVKNNSLGCVSISADMTAYDASGSTIGAQTSNIDILGPDEQSIMPFYFSDVTGIDKVDYKLSYDTRPSYEPVIANLKTEQTVNDKNLTVVATNTGEYSAEFVQAHALFFDSEGNVIYYNSSYMTDNDDEIKPGATLSAQIDAYQDFDHVECYFSGRSTGKATTSNNKQTLSDDEFNIVEYGYENSIGSSQYYLIITNNSTIDVGIDGNMTAYDADNNVIGAANSSIDILAPGEQSIAPFFFNSVSGIDHVEYTLSYDTSPYYKPVISDIEFVQHINDKNVVIMATNNGDEPAKFVQAYALFFDADNNIVYSNSGYITDDDSEIKPGATLSTQLDAYGTFDHVECYYTGRKN